MPSKLRYRTLSMAAVCLMALPAVTSAQPAMNETQPMDVTTPYPTLIHLAIEWRVRGDDNLNGVVTVRFRERGTDTWREGMPLRRVPAGTLPIRPSPTPAQREAGERPEPARIFEWANKHSGSLFDLQPGTEYEIELTLRDPDGGDAIKRVTASTRREPRAMRDAPVRRVTPASIAELKPRPGDIVQLAPGDYGAFVARHDGAPSRPIVYRSADGSARFTSIELGGRSFVHVEGVTVENPAERGKGIDLMGTESCVVRWCTIRAAYGVSASARPGARNAYVADNVIEGPSTWSSETMGARGRNLGEGVRLTGPGNVICYNRVRGFRDGISTMEMWDVEEQVSVDIYHNDVLLGADDGIEADYCGNNCRIVGNRLTNCFVGVSSQPSLGGPTYFIRNAMYNVVYSPFKLHNRSDGNVVLHNTVVSVGDAMACYTSAPFSDTYFRNNLAIGGPPGKENWGGYGAGTGQAVVMYSPGPRSDFDYDALGVFRLPFRGQIGGQRFESFEQMTAGPHERHAVQVGMDVFDGVAYPLPPVPEHEPQDLRPVAGSAIVDRGQPIPNVNDGYAGDGPDMGAYEAGQPLPHYGPRRRPSGR